MIHCVGQHPQLLLRLEAAFVRALNDAGFVIQPGEFSSILLDDFKTVLKAVRKSKETLVRFTEGLELAGTVLPKLSTAPSFHVDDKNLDPKTWCRFPILSGGFQYELAQLPTTDRES